MTDRYDIAIIGGGIHGVGVAQAAAAAGYSTLLLERTELAAGTSSRSSKLIHGGLRYLESAQLGLVRESLRERETLLRLAPGLVRRVPFYLPVYRTTSRRPWQMRLGLSLYAVLGGFRPTTRFAALPRAHWENLDGLDTRGLQTVFRYHDAQTDDAALTRAVMRSAQSLGAELLCPAEFIGAENIQEGYRVRYAHAGTETECRAHTLVNAAGPWANDILARLTPAVTPRPVELVQGTHLLLEGATRQGVYYVEAVRDRRAVFVMPWQGHTLVGTTETRYTGDPARVAPLPPEIAYLHETFRRYFPQRRDQIISSFAGLRVLPAGGGAHFHRTRETLLHPDNDRHPQLITIYGGKLTGYRATADKTLECLRVSLPVRTRIADTSKLFLSDPS
jgi:glycerol-3-phosphate dehydrogenase